jgi:hypothetical protein
MPVFRSAPRAYALRLCLVLIASFATASFQSLSAQNKPTAATYDRSGPWWQIVPRPLFSMAYTPEPSDYGAQFTCPFPDGCKYFDSDFYNSDFNLLWGPNGRNDLQTLSSIHSNNLHLYDWSTCRDHIPFLNYASQNGLTVWVPFSNYNVSDPYDPVRRANIENIFREVYGLDASNNGRKTPNPGVILWGIGNEYDINGYPAAFVAQVARIVVDMENAAGIADANKLIFTSPVSFAIRDGKPPAIQQILDLQTAFINAGLSDIWYTRFMASTATTNDAPFMQNYITSTFPNSGDFSSGDGLALFLSEYGANGQDACLFYHANDPACREPSQQQLRDQSQADYNAAEFQVGVELARSAPTSQTGYFYGFSVFQWQDAFWKCPGTICTESQFGIQRKSTQLTEGTIGGGKCGIPVNTYRYPVPNFEHKLAWDITVNAFAP